jgi:hypothetical protein
MCTLNVMNIILTKFDILVDKIQKCRITQITTIFSNSCKKPMNFSIRNIVRARSNY